MKLIYAIVSNDDSSAVSSALTKVGFFVMLNGAVRLYLHLRIINTLSGNWFFRARSVGVAFFYCLFIIY